MSLREYRRKRSFGRTPEPPPVRRRARSRRDFVVQKHAASRLHYDFRLEHDGVLKSWAVPKGPSLDPGEKRLAVEVEDHPIEYGRFEGVIPKGQYGAGRVEIWDAGHWIPKGDVDEGLRKGRLEFALEGKRLQGAWVLVRMHSSNGKERNWLLIKRTDDAPPPARGRERLPDFVEPELATLVEKAPAGDEWFHEIKYDGYRVLARIEKGRLRLLTRKGLDWTAKFAELSPALEKLPVDRALLDGEVVVFRPDGTSSFSDLQKALSEGTRGKLRYCVFDLLHLDGDDLRESPLEDRKARLKKILPRGKGVVRFSDHVVGDGAGFHREACRLGLEGIVSKRKDRPYRSVRSRDWLKVKCGLAQEFVVAGYTRPSGSRVGLGALVLGVREGGKLRYAGRVGTGFDHATLARLRKRLEPMRIESPPFEARLSATARRGALWVRPELVAEVRFTGWTADGIVRHPTFRGLREDKPAREVVRERPKKEPRDGDPVVAGIRVTHPDRVVYPGAKLTKLDLARYYERMAPRILPHVAGRPLSVLRCPSGQGGECFFQKHGHATFPEAVGSIEVAEKKGKARYLSVDSAAGLVALVQMGVLELHPWGSRGDLLEKPDRMTFDIDPAPDVRWPLVVQAARTLRETLADLGLEPFLKTTGGKGLHVVVPLARRNGWDEVKEFSRAVVTRMAAAEPKLYLATASKAARRGRIFLDYLRNGRGATAVAPWSTRARPGAPVSAPVDWKELDEGLRSDSIRVDGIEERLRGRRDPWRDFDARARSITRDARRAVGRV